jgi:hypothetical protein
MDGAILACILFPAIAGVLVLAFFALLSSGYLSDKIRTIVQCVAFIAFFIAIAVLDYVHLPHPHLIAFSFFSPIAVLLAVMGIDYLWRERKQRMGEGRKITSAEIDAEIDAVNHRTWWEDREERLSGQHLRTRQGPQWPKANTDSFGD